MKEEAQRIAIAEACGWKQHGKFRYELPDGRQFCVDILHDLNAIHEALKILTEPQCWEFSRQLSNIQATAKGKDTSTYDQWSWFATAEQWAEARLKTIGKWVEE